MPVDPALIEMLVCPVHREPVRPATAEELGAVNDWIAAGRARNIGGESVTEPLAGGLVAPSARLLYPITDDFPVMLRDAALALDQAVDGGATGT